MYSQKPSNSEKELKAIVPTLIIGIGGTGLEAIMRLRRLITESYGSLENFPIVGFLHIDTDAEAKTDEPLMAGPPLENYEKYHSNVNLQEVETIVNQPEEWDWYHEWLPPEISTNPQLLASEKGAGQIRACGRFSFFFNYQKINQACNNIKRKIRENQHRSLMSDRYGLDVKNQLNIFVICSIAGGTGSGMLIDLGYCLKSWFAGEPLKTTAVISTPDAFGNVDVNNLVNRNGYAALMELNYYCDQDTNFSVRYQQNEGSRVESKAPPYDFIYLVGTTNEYGVNIKLNDVREMMAQQIFLDLVSDFSPYKRSIRDNISRQATGQNDKPPRGRSYPRNFMSFGLATIEVPIYHIRSCLASYLATDLCQWWQNDQVPLPVEPQTMVDAELRNLNLSNNELRKTILRAQDKPYPYNAVVVQWVSSMRQEIISENQLQCTAQGINFFSREKGKILNFVKDYLQPKVDEYKANHFRDESPDTRNHGDYLLVMYDHRNELIQTATDRLQEQIYTDLRDRSLGPKFLGVKLDLMERVFERDIQQMEREAEKTWSKVETGAWKQYDEALSRLDELSRRWGLTKQSQMNQECNATLENLEKALNAILERKSRVIAVEVLRHLKEFIEQLKSQLNKWQMRVARSRANFQERANKEANQADALNIVGIKMFSREDLNQLYDNFLANIVNSNEGNIINAEAKGKEQLCEQLTSQILSKSSPLWEGSRQARQEFRLLDLEKISEIQYPDFEKEVYEVAYNSILDAPKNTKLYTDMDVCQQFLREFPQTVNQRSQIEQLFDQSKPLIQLDKNIPQNSGFNYIPFAKAGLLGGDNPTEDSAIKLSAILKQYFTGENAVAPLTTRERHKILSVHEIGGFSLRCLLGIKKMRQAYQKWRGERVIAERKKLRGQQADIPSSVHIQKDLVFWDFIPPDPTVEGLVVIMRALEMLREEENQNTKQFAICYSAEVRGEKEKITLAANWEDTVQVLQLPDCRNDKKALEGQLEELLDQAQTPEAKQKIRKKLDSYLEQRLQDFRKQGGDDNPRYLREKDIIRDFINQNKLGEFLEKNEIQVAPTPVSEFTPKFCHRCGAKLSPGTRFCTSCGAQIR
ncbi:MAG: zinc-ribbon domain-containing protein [Trichodesmium sp. St15_bin1_1]|nr:zinc-ribbon domain-containing protein [Trichodesmium sp. St18_bin1]MDE5114837.1 zinc-ribbon domain-containing protein [Trichodesmium sp. St15_bin1_1]MDE5117696.1 zinc-ribbon domain-containing protein [Trichodesmium sp. St2_bin2_1]MDE5120951.1 zinc-ribbon domain-containing protein [Trichodesmium sp. St19_bin1]